MARSVRVVVMACLVEIDLSWGVDSAAGTVLSPSIALRGAGSGAKRAGDAGVYWAELGEE